jgi:hypothetical protein
MKKSLYILLCCFGSHLFGQPTTKNLDLILTIDERIVTGSVSSVKIFIVSKEGEQNIKANYYPGNLSIAIEDYLLMTSENTKTIYLSFSYTDYVYGKHNNYGYKIELKKEWLGDRYNILHICNLTNKKYKRKLKGQNYLYELDSPSNTFKLIQSRR